MCEDISHVRAIRSRYIYVYMYISSRSKLPRYYNKESLKGEILLDSILVRSMSQFDADADNREFAFGIYNRKKHRLVMVVAAKSEQERSDWVGDIQHIIYAQQNSDAIFLTVNDVLKRQGICSVAILPTSRMDESTDLELEQLKNDPTAALRSVKRAADINFFEGFCNVKNCDESSSGFRRLFSFNSWEKRRVVVSGRTK